MTKYLFLLILLLSAIPVYAQSEAEPFKKTGWDFAALPAVSFDNDLGFQYGAFVNLFQYGDGSRYPDYDHSLYFEASRYTRGSGVYRFYYDSDRLIPGIQSSMDLSFLTDQTYDFYGFNGYDAVFNDEWIDDGHGQYQSRVFYKYQRKLFLC